MSTENYDQNVQDPSQEIIVGEVPGGAHVGNELKSEGPEQPFTLGQTLMGVSFNPSRDPNVDRIKALAAEMADLLFSAFEDQSITGLHKNMIDDALMQILHAQMMAVKVVTFKM